MTQKYRRASTTLISQAVAAISFILTMIGMNAMDAGLQQDIVSWIGSAITLVSSAVAIRGRIRATTKLVNKKTV